MRRNNKLAISTSENFKATSVLLGYPHAAYGFKLVGNAHVPFRLNSVDPDFRSPGNLPASITGPFYHLETARYRYAQFLVLSVLRCTAVYSVPGPGNSRISHSGEPRSS